MTSMRPGLALALLLIAAATLLLVIYRSQFPRGGVADQEQEAGPQLAEAAHWSAHQLAAFMRAREQLYARRRERVRSRCSSNPVSKASNALVPAAAACCWPLTQSSARNISPTGRAEWLWCTTVRTR